MEVWFSIYYLKMAVNGVLTEVYLITRGSEVLWGITEYRILPKYSISRWKFRINNAKYLPDLLLKLGWNSARSTRACDQERHKNTPCQQQLRSVRIWVKVGTCLKKPSDNWSRITKRLKMECFRRASVLNGRENLGAMVFARVKAPRPRVKGVAEIRTIKINYSDLVCCKKATVS